MKIETEKLLTDLASKLGTYVEHVYEVLTKQAKTKILAHVIGLVLNFTGLAIILTIALNCHYVAPTPPLDITYETICWSISWLLTIGMFINLFSGLSYTISCIYGLITNPEYYAIQEILETLSNHE